MNIIEIKALGNGAHHNQSGARVCPEGWAVIPDDMVCENFPFGELTVDNSMPPVVTSWTPLPIPQPEPGPEPEPEPDDLGARVTALENDVTAITEAVERGLSL